MSDTSIVVVRDPEITVVVREDPTTVVAVSAPGPQGPPGPTGATGATGAPGSGSSSFVYEQIIPAATWPIDHGLGYVPNWFVKDSAGDEWEFNRTDPSVNQSILDFDGVAVSGFAYAS